MSFFGTFGDELEFQNLEDMDAKLSSIDALVPPRIQGRTRDHREKYAIMAFLRGRSESNAFLFPFNVKKLGQSEEPPDFVLQKCDESTIGIECVEAGSEEYQARMAHSERTGDILISRGYEGEEPERQWAEDICVRIIQKIQGLNSGRYRSADSYELLVYDNTESGHLFVIGSLDMAFEYLRRCIQELESTNNFTKIWVVRGGELIHDILNGT